MEQSLVANVTTANLIVVIAVSLLAALLGLALYLVSRGNSTRLSGASEARLQPLDVLAFNNLIDKGEEDFLRRELAPSTFRGIQRLRLRAAAEYVICASRNAGVIIRMGREWSSNTQNPREAQEMVTSAIHLRLLAIFVLCLLWLKIAFPSLRLSLKDISTLHERLLMQQASLSRINSARRLLSNA